MNYPPFCDLIQFTVTNKVENSAHNDALSLYSLIDSFSNGEYSDIPIRLLYPTVPKIAKFNDKYRYNLVIKSRLSSRLYEMLENLIYYFEQNLKSNLSININPMNNV